jgi:mannose/cellobiose epimerase-like protein (N-acyl-D-glucosamine 2-epimerase family)
MPGLWIDAFDASGQPVATAIPTSTFYHLFLAFAEILRIAPRLK